MLAEGLLGRGLHALAAEEYAALAAMDDATPDILYRLGECHHRLDKWLEAEAAFARLVEKFPGSVEAVRAQLQRAQKTPERAAELLAPFREWRGDPALESAVLLALADAFGRANKPAEAVAAYDEILKRFPDSQAASLARLNAGLALLATDNADNHKRGALLLLDVANKNPDPQWAAEALYALAQHEYKRENYADSAGYFALLATRHPDSQRTTASRLQAAWASFLSGDRDAALKLLDAHPVADKKSIDQQSWLYLRANLLRLKNDDAARAAYEKLFADFPKLDPKFSEARFEYAALLYGQKDYASLAKFFEQGHDFSAHAETAAWMQAVATLEKKQRDEALALFQKFEKEFPNSPLQADAICHIARIFSEQEKFSEVAQTFTCLAKNHPTAPVAQDAWFRAGAAWNSAHDYNQAVTTLKQGLDEKPDAPNSDYWAYMCGQIATDINRYAEAESALTFVIDRFPQSQYRAKAFFARGISRHNRDNKDLKGSEDDLRACLDVNSDDSTRNLALFSLGHCMREQNRDAEAAACFQPIIDRLGKRELFWLAQFQLDAGQPVLAEAAAHALLDIIVLNKGHDPSVIGPGAIDHQVAHSLLARALHAQDKNTEAIASLRTALMLDANTPDAINDALLLGRLLLEANDFPGADAAFQDAIKRASTPEFLAVRVDAYLGLAQSAEAAGKPENALRYFLTVALLFDDPERVPAALDAAMKLCEKLNRPDEAKQHRKELLERYPESTQAKKIKEKG